ncbi:MAG: hypothetical protein H7Y17_09130 [Chlorobia bacterium]|nr:hypothetical protein [Fimbriimonadaceae bacterium]
MSKREAPEIPAKNSPPVHIDPEKHGKPSTIFEEAGLDAEAIREGLEATPPSTKGHELAGEKEAHDDPQESPSEPNGNAYKWKTGENEQRDLVIEGPKTSPHDAEPG